MSYEKNTWVTGDTITATKLNNIENGIANASWPWITVTMEGFSDVGSFSDGTIGYVKAVESGQYAGQLVFVNGGSLYSNPIETVGNPTMYYNMTRPPVNDISMVFAVASGAGVSCSFDGDIATTAVTVRWDAGSSIVMNGYVITGDCSITITSIE